MTSAPLAQLDHFELHNIQYIAYKVKFTHVCIRAYMNKICENAVRILQRTQPEFSRLLRLDVPA